MTPEFMFGVQGPIQGLGLQDHQLTPNNAMKRTPLPVTSFACAKEPPGGGRRLSRR